MIINIFKNLLNEHLNNREKSETCIPYIESSLSKSGPIFLSASNYRTNKKRYKLM